MFLRLLTESFRRQKRRKALAGAAILLGTTAVTAMLALATTIGDRIHSELAVYGANIVVTPKAANLDVNLGGVNLKPATGGAYLHEADLEKLKTIFWANNITGVSPEFSRPAILIISGEKVTQTPATATAYWFHHRFSTIETGGPQLHPWWRLRGRWPAESFVTPKHREDAIEVVLGATLAQRLHLKIGDTFTLSSPSASYAPEAQIVGIVASGDATDDQVLFPLDVGLARAIVGQAQTDAVQNADLTRIEIAARTRPEDAFARKDPDTLHGKQRDLWYCRPYANSIAYQIREAIPGADAQQVRRVEQSEGTVLSRISGLMWLISAAALLAAGFAVSAAMATAILERRQEIGLMRSLGAGKAAVAALFLAESTLLALAAGTLGYFGGSLLARTLGAHIFPAAAPGPAFNLVLLPVILGLAVLVAIAGALPSLRAGLNADPANTLRGTA